MQTLFNKNFQVKRVARQIFCFSWERIAKKEGKIKGIEEGLEKKAKETAMKMLEDGLPIETIIKYTGLTEKEVKELMS